MNVIQKYWLCLIVVLLTLGMSTAYAGIDETPGAKTGPFVVGDSLVMRDGKFLNNAAWSTFQNRSVIDQVSLRVVDGSRLTANFTYKVGIKIECFNDRFSDLPTSTIDTSLSVTYDISQGVSYQGVSTIKFNGAFKVRIKIITQGRINPATDLAPPAGAVQLTGLITVDRVYNFNTATLLPFNASLIDTAKRTLPLAWNVLTGAEEYDVEWATVDSGDVNENVVQAMLSNGDPLLTAKAGLLFDNNSTRITTATQGYTIGLTYNNDYLMVRIRGVQYDVNGIRICGAWSYKIGTSFAIWKIKKYWLYPRQNWQYSASYAEEGKRKEVVSYFDGTLRNRQTITLNNTDNLPVVAENIYDLFGRPVAAILPAPVLIPDGNGKKHYLEYVPSLNVDLSGNPYDYADINDPSAAGCEFLPGALKTSKGSSNYYSAISDFKSTKPYQYYVPDADGYPLSVTQYTPDNTGRVRYQGGVGATFQPGAAAPSHTTRYIYGKPDQWELDQLFGNDVGFAEHYSKNTVIDPNNQISVSYLNASGKTIATALSGRQPAGMDSLSSKVPLKFKTSIILRPEQFSFDVSALKVSATTTYAATTTGPDTIRYDLPSLMYSFAQTGQLCAKCYYDLKIRVNNVCNTAMPDIPVINIGTKSANNLNCTPDGNVTGMIPMNFDIGEYNISFDFTLSREDVNAYADTLLNRGQKAGLINTQWKYVKDKLDVLEFNSMFSDCKTAKALLGTQGAFRILYGKRAMALGVDTTKFTAAELLQYQNMVTHNYVRVNTYVNNLTCPVPTPCDDLQAQMIKDVSLGGQYALFDENGQPVEQELNVLFQNWRLVFPKLAKTNATSIANRFTNDDGFQISPNDSTFTFTDFVHYWNPDWGSRFLTYHPEYCKLSFCQLNSASEVWNETVKSVDKATNIATIQAGLSYSYTNSAWLLPSDPFFKTTGKGKDFYTSMQNDLNNYSVRVLGQTGTSFPNKSLAQFVDYILYCGEGNWSGCSATSCRIPDRDWTTYRNYYLSLKDKYYKKLRDSSLYCGTACKVGQTYSPPAAASCASTSDFYVSTTSLADLASAQATGACPDSSRYFITVAYKFGKVVNNTYVFLSYPNAFAQNLPASALLTYANSKAYICVPKELSIGDVKIREANCTGNIPYLYLPNPSTAGTLNVYRTNASTSTTDILPGCDYYIQSAKDVTAIGQDTVYEITIKVKPKFFYCKRKNLQATLNIQRGWDGEVPLYGHFTVPVDSVNLSARVRVHVGVVPYALTLNNTSVSGSITSCSLPISSNNNGCSYSLADKTSRFDFNAGITSVPTDTALIKLMVATQIKNKINGNCEANADRWMASLAEGLKNRSADTIATLRYRLTKFCADNGDSVHVYGASTWNGKYPNLNSPDNSFGDIIKRTLNLSSFTPLLNPWLLDGPNPYDVPVQNGVMVIANSSADISAQIAAQKAAKVAAAYSGTLYQYLVSKYGPAMTMSEGELGMLDSASAGCRWVLRNAVTLPVFLQKGSKGCITYAEYTAAKTQLTGLIPGFSSSSANYSTILANFMNQKFGFTMAADTYLAYEASHPGLLCNAPPATEAVTDLYADMQSKMETAISGAIVEYNTYAEDQRNLLRSNYIEVCGALRPVVTNKAQVQNYHFTLYYYDQADNLVRTIPPEGVQVLSDAQVAQVQQIRSTGDVASCGTAYTGPTVKADENVAYTNLGSRLGASQNGAIELWLYNTTNSGNQFSKVTPDGQYQLQVNIKNNTLGVDIFSKPAFGQFSQSNRVTVSLTKLSVLQAWTHVVIQSTNLLTGKLNVYVNGVKATIVNNAPPVTFAENTGSLKHMRLYGHLLYPAEIMINANNSCFMPLNSDGYWARFNLPAQGGETTVSNTITETKINGIYPVHTLPTSYLYNSTNQAVIQYSPDGGTNRFWYDMLSRVAASQNDKQKPLNKFSYTSYDSLGRVVEVGQKTTTNPGFFDPGFASDSSLWVFKGNLNNEQITKTYYDAKGAANIVGLQTNLEQNNLRKRVVASTYQETQSGLTARVQNATYYNYDIDGNVKTLYQQVKGLETKWIDYEYDLISGKVNFVKYQYRPADSVQRADQFYYQYNYDAENRLTHAYSGTSAMLRTFGGSFLLKESRKLDAYYQYYLHGPLARMELGDDVSGKVQGLDYAYTLQGWLKGVNNQNITVTSGAAKDIGEDGLSGTHSTIAKDAFGFALGYYNGDYKPVGTTAVSGAFNAPFVPSIPSETDYTGQNLYNGNISSSTLAVRQAELGNGTMVGYTYHYDQLNRLKTMRQHAGISTGWGKSSIIQNFGENITYDGNGNILSFNRHGSSPTASTIDSLKYNYNYDQSGKLINNRLNYIKDNIGTSNYTGDLQSQNAGNYVYDEIGNLIKNTKEDNGAIDWNVYGKILKITKPTGNITYTYDPSGNRVSKLNNSGTTWYVRDAQGNTLAIYNGTSLSVTWKEQQLYGSSRLGIWTPNLNLATTSISKSQLEFGKSGNKFFELTNHLGNVIATISDKRLQTGSPTPTFLPDIINAQDYYSFGMIQPNRQFTVTGASKYRYGFNGKENDNEIKLDGNGNEVAGAQQDYGMRIYDPRVGRFLSVDPLNKSYPFYTPYSFAGNNPIKFIDLDGEEEYDPTQDPFFVAKLLTTTFYDVKHSIENVVFNTFVPNDPGKKWLATYKVKNGQQVFETVIRQVPKRGAVREIVNSGLDVANIFFAGKGLTAKSFDASMLFAETGGETQVTRAIREGTNVERSVIRLNQEAGYIREAEELASLKVQNPTASVQSERYLRTADGKIAKDPLTGEARRVDFAVIENGQAKRMVETTSLTADKTAQTLKERRIRAAGGTYIRDKQTRKLINVSNVQTEVVRRK